MQFSLLVPIVIAAAAAPASGKPDSDPRPVVLETEQAATNLRISVIGNADHPVKVHYRLEADSGQTGGSNRSVQSGVAQLKAHDRKTLISLTLGNVSEGAWVTRLEVDVENGQHYEITRAGPAAGS